MANKTLKLLQETDYDHAQEIISEFAIEVNLGQDKASLTSSVRLGP